MSTSATARFFGSDKWFSQPLVPFPPVPTHMPRLAMLRRFLTDPGIPLRTRMAACPLLPYGQPIVRPARLTIDDIHTHNGEPRLHLGTPASPVPEPFAAMPHELANDRANMNTATNPRCSWMFPGHRAGHPVTPGAPVKQLQGHCLPVTRTRTAAFRRLVRHAPAPVTARALDYHPHTATKHVSDSGGTWSQYPATRDSGTRDRRRPHSGNDQS